MVDDCVITFLPQRHVFMYIILLSNILSVYSLIPRPGYEANSLGARPSHAEEEGLVKLHKYGCGLLTGFLSNN